MWFTTGWCAIFILFSIFLAVKLAKFYRIMDEEALPKVKKSKKGASSRGLSDQEMALEDMSEDGHTGDGWIRSNNRMYHPLRSRTDSYGL